MTGNSPSAALARRLRRFLIPTASVAMLVVMAPLAFVLTSALPPRSEGAVEDDRFAFTSPTDQEHIPQVAQLRGKGRPDEGQDLWIFGQSPDGYYYQLELVEDAALSDRWSQAVSVGQPHSAGKRFVLMIALVPEAETAGLQEATRHAMEELPDFVTIVESVVVYRLPS